MLQTCFHNCKSIAITSFLGTIISFTATFSRSSILINIRWWRCGINIPASRTIVLNSSLEIFSLLFSFTFIPSGEAPIKLYLSCEIHPKSSTLVLKIDEIKRALDDVQKVTDSFINDVNSILSNKEKEILL